MCGTPPILYRQQPTLSFRIPLLLFYLLIISILVSACAPVSADKIRKSPVIFQRDCPSCSSARSSCSTSSILSTRSAFLKILRRFLILGKLTGSIRQSRTPVRDLLQKLSSLELSKTGQCSQILTPAPETSARRWEHCQAPIFDI